MVDFGFTLVSNQLVLASLLERSLLTSTLETDGKTSMANSFKKLHSHLSTPQHHRSVKQSAAADIQLSLTEVFKYKLTDQTGVADFHCSIDGELNGALERVRGKALLNGLKSFSSVLSSSNAVSSEREIQKSETVCFDFNAENSHLIKLVLTHKCESLTFGSMRSSFVVRNQQSQKRSCVKRRKWCSRCFV